MQRTDYWKIPWCLERLKADGKGAERGWDGWMESPTQWTWVWVNSGSWWWTGKSDVLHFMGSQNQTRLSDWTQLTRPFALAFSYPWHSMVMGGWETLPLNEDRKGDYHMNHKMKYKQRFSKWGLQTPRSPQRDLSRWSGRSKLFFRNNTKALFIFFIVLTFAVVLQKYQWVNCWLISLNQGSNTKLS